MIPIKDIVPVCDYVIVTPLRDCTALLIYNSELVCINKLTNFIHTFRLIHKNGCIWRSIPSR